MTRLAIDVAAWHDLDQIGAWIAKDNPRAARAVLEKILRTIELLRPFPLLARPGRAHGTYERVVPGTPYIIVLEVRRNPAAMIIVAVAHGARNR
jgi:plasmid stabilization system protein ParE